MEGKSLMEDVEDPDFFINIKNAIEKELFNIRKILNNINQLRVETAYLESELVMTIDSSTWEDISELIGLASMHMANASMKDEIQ